MELEINEDCVDKTGKFAVGNTIATITPMVNSEYFLFRVKLFNDQAILGFPKFSTIGIGFAVEDNDWNTNLPYTCNSEEIFNHIKCNKKYKEITKEDCINAIELIQNACKIYKK